MHPCARDRVSSAHLTIRPLSSVQPELAVDRADLGRLDQTRMRHGDRVQRAFQGLQPEIEEFVERRKYRAEIVVLPNIALQQPGVIRPPVQNVSCGQPIAFKLPPKVLRHHGPLHPITRDVSRLSSPLQATKLTKLFTFKATVPTLPPCRSLLATSLTEC